MGRRRRRKIVRVVRRRLPEVFVCPKCGSTSVKVFIDTLARTAKVTCSICNLHGDLEAPPYSEQVDIYSKFSDLFYSGAIK